MNADVVITPHPDNAPFEKSSFIVEIQAADTGEPLSGYEDIYEVVGKKQARADAEALGKSIVEDGTVEHAAVYFDGRKYRQFP